MKVKAKFVQLCNNGIVRDKVETVEEPNVRDGKILDGRSFEVSAVVSTPNLDPKVHVILSERK